MRLHMRHTSHHLRCRPDDLYLGALTSRGELEFFCHVDVSTFDEELVRDWLEEVKNATVAYLDGASDVDSVRLGAAKL